MPIRRGPCLLLTLALASPLAAAPQSWELQNGQWRPITEDATTRPLSDPTLDRAEQLLTHNGYAAANQITIAWLKANKKSPLRDRALLLLAESYYQSGDRLVSFYECDHLMDDYPDSPLFYRALELQYKIAEAFLDGYKRRLFGMAILGAEQEGVEMLYRIQQRSPGSPLAEKALLRSADYYYATSQFDLAGDAYTAYVHQYPRSPVVPRARLRSAFSSLAQFRGLPYDATPLIEARTQLVDLATAYPDLAKQENLEDVVQRIDKSFARKLLRTADFYRRTHDPASAVYSYRFLIQSYPDSPEADQAKQALAQMPPSALQNPAPPGAGDHLLTTQPTVE
jgi:outer membrane protein assembly factor BamD (BamD/ComL family)